MRRTLFVMFLLATPAGVRVLSAAPFFERVVRRTLFVMFLLATPARVRVLSAAAVFERVVRRTLFVIVCAQRAIFCFARNALFFVLRATRAGVRVLSAVVFF